MNHDPPLSSPAQPGAGPSHANAGDNSNTYSYDNAVGGNQSPVSNDGSRPNLHSQRRRRRKNRKKRTPGLKKKLTFVTHLLQGLDTIVFAELSALYYMECSLFRFLIRAAGQFMYLSPKDETFPFLMPAGRMHVVLVIVPNLWCMLVHFLASLPQGPEYHREYQHGGLIIDFIGQKPPKYRLYYMLADLVLLVLQCLMLTIHTEREKLRLSLKTFRPIAPDPAAELSLTRTLEDLDAEEQAVQSGPGVEGENEEGDMELRPLRSATGDTEASRPDEYESLGNNSGDEPSRSHLSDVLNSGNAVLGDYHVINAFRLAWSDVERNTATSLQTIGYRATLAALEAQRRGVAVPGQTG